MSYSLLFSQFNRFSVTSSVGECSLFSRLISKNKIKRYVHLNLTFVECNFNNFATKSFHTPENANDYDQIGLVFVMYPGCNEIPHLHKARRISSIHTVVINITIEAMMSPKQQNGARLQHDIFSQKVTGRNGNGRSGSIRDNTSSLPDEPQREDGQDGRK